MGEFLEEYEGPEWARELLVQPTCRVKVRLANYHHGTLCCAVCVCVGGGGGGK